MAEAEIYDIRWHRAILELRYIASEDSRIPLYLTDGKTRIPFEDSTDAADVRDGSVPSGDARCNGSYRGSARLNLMTAMGRAPLPRGCWMIGSGTDTVLRYDPRLLEDPDAYTMFFRYGKAKYGYAVWLTVRQAEDGALSVGLQVDFYQRNPNPRIRKRSLRFLEKKVFRAVYRLIRNFVRRGGKRILFYKQNGDGPTENMAALIRRMEERGIDRQYRIRYRYRNVFAGKQNVMAWLKDLVQIAGSDYIFIDDYAPVFDFIVPDDGVVLTQLWHAGVGFKSVGYARFGLDGSPDPFSSSHRHYTYALVGNAALRDIYAEVFGIEREALLATGMPRLDHFLDEERAQASRADLFGRYPQLRGRRIILFAPTYRGTGQRTAYYPYEMLNNEALHALCEETDSIFIYEMHHYITRLPQIPQDFRDRILDLTNERLSDLYYIADVLITDYSSCFYDYLLLGRPVILYVPDRSEYTAMHGVQRSIGEMAPGEICETFEALTDTLRTEHYKNVMPRSVTIDRAAERSGLASDRVIDTILFGADVPDVKMERQTDPRSVSYGAVSESD